jgi:twinkle protein
MEKNPNGLYTMPTLYDINGSANFYNKCDYGLSVFRDFTKGIVQVNVIKVKFKHLGEGGAITLVYNYNNGRYEPNNTPVYNWDNQNYLHPDTESMPKVEDEYIDAISPFNDYKNEAPF